MARPDRPPAEHLGFFARVGESVKHWGLFPVLRGAEARAHGLPRIGRSRLPTQDVVELAQAPTLGFAESTIESIEVKRGRGRVTGRWLGLLGPMGPMPGHLTEFANFERMYAKSRPFGRFLDMIAGRMLQLFYRAWADSEPVAHADRPGDDRFAGYLAQLSGASEGVAAASSFPPAARIHYAGLFASRRGASVVEDLLTDLLGQPTRVIEYIPRWRDLEDGDRTRLDRGDFSRLGGGAMLGGRTRIADDTYRVAISARSAADYATLLPTGNRLAIAVAALDAISPGHLEWEILLEVREAEAAPAQLGGGAMLGWTSWMRQPQDAGGWRRDARLRRQSIKLTRRGAIAAAAA